MKELSKEQEVKLLEMVKKFFPEYLVPTIQGNGYINIMETEYSSDYIDLIHWFEFCINTLSEKVIINVYNSDYLKGIKLSFLEDTLINKIKHPVDYLYDIFLIYLHRLSFVYTEIPMSDFTLVEVDDKNQPKCTKHGGMLKVSNHTDGGGYYRCITTVSEKKDNCCTAACLQLKKN